VVSPYNDEAMSSQESFSPLYHLGYILRAPDWN
jgi:hypothetical protein